MGKRKMERQKQGRGRVSLICGQIAALQQAFLRRTFPLGNATITEWTLAPRIQQVYAVALE